MHKIKHEWPWLPILFAILSFILLLFVIRDQIESTKLQPKTIKQVLGNKTQNETQAFPIRLKIPSINVDAAIEAVGLTTNGAMAVPDNTIDVGWFNLGTLPGEKGSAVIAGHYDGENGQEGVFANLSKLKGGDKLYIEDGKGTTLTFVVQQSHTYNPGYADDVFNRSDIPHLNLITCDGVWNKAKKSYTKRLVVFADIAN